MIDMPVFHTQPGSVGHRHSLLVAQIVAALTGGDTSEAEKHMGTWLATVVSWLQSMASSSDTESG